MTRTSLSGMAGFGVVWLGQLVSALGSTMTGFAISIWAWQDTGQATALALVGFFSFMPTILFSPLAGALIDRLNRKLVLVLSDFGPSASALAMLLLYFSGNLEIWHLYLLGAVAGAFNAFHAPAFAATISTMLPEAQFARANGMMSLAASASSLAAPVLAGLLLNVLGLEGILILDLLTFAFAFLTLALVAIPQPKVSEEGKRAQGGLLEASGYGFSYIFRRSGLRALLFLYVAINLIGAFGMVMLTPMTLARSGGDELALGSVLSALGAGGIAGGFIMSAWGGPKRRIHGVLLGLIMISLFGYGLLALGQGVAQWMLAAFFITFFLPVLSGCNQAIWQASVAPDVQGRVFAARQSVSQLAMPVVMLVAGPLADRLFEPMMMPGAVLADSFGELVGTGEGAGMALMFLVFGTLGLLLGLSGYLFPSLREIEAKGKLGASSAK